MYCIDLSMDLFVFVNCFNEFVICFAVAVFVLNVIVLLFVSVCFCWRDHVLSSRIYVYVIPI